MSKQKPVNWELIEDNDLYTFVQELVEKYHDGKNSIVGINFVLMWRHNVKIDQDDYLLLADITKSSDKVRELRPHDVIIGINKTAWNLMELHQKEAVIDAQLERIAECLDKEGNQKEDDQGRPLYRLRRPEVIDEQTIQRRHNTTIQAIQEFVIQKIKTAGAESGSYVANALANP